MKQKKRKIPSLTHDKTGGLLNFMDYRNPANKVFYAFLLFFLAIFVLVALFPIFWLIVNAFKSPSQFNDPNAPFFPLEWNFQSVTRLFVDFEFGNYYLVTVIVVLLAVVFSLVFNGLMAYVTGVLKPKGYKVLHAMVFAAYMIPGILSIVPLYGMIVNFYKGLGIEGANPIHFITVSLCFGSNAYYYMLLKDYFEKIPASLIEAASMDGLSDFRIFLKIILPLSKPILSVVAIFTMTAAYSDFLLPYIVLNGYGGDSFKTLMVEIFTLQSANSTVTTPELLLAILFSILPQLLMFLIFQKQIMNGNVSAGMKE